MCDEINAFASEMLRVSQPRDDYKELLELVLIFTGYMKNPTFKIPRAMHRARWMSKAIYVLEIYLFWDEFPLVASEKNMIRRLSIFVSSIYIFGWYNAPFSIQGPRNDLMFLEKLRKFKKIDEKIANATIKKFSSHYRFCSNFGKIFFFVMFFYISS